MKSHFWWPMALIGKGEGVKESEEGFDVGSGQILSELSLTYIA